MSQENLQTMIMQNLWGGKRDVLWDCASSEWAKRSEIQFSQKLASVKQMCYSDEKSIATLLMVKYDENSCFHTLTIIPENEKHSVSIHLPLMNALCSFICKLKTEAKKGK